MRSTVLVATISSAILLLPLTLFSWGPEGHEIVALLAQRHLSETARQGVRSLLGDASLASLANWADEIRPERDETYNWHFVDIPMSAAGFSDERDCFLPDSNHKDASTDHHNCVVDRIGTFQKVLSDTSNSKERRVEALKFVVHFVGDIHQPFHAIGEERGGNGITVTEFGSKECGRHPCNLHSTWDSGLIRHAGMTREEYVLCLEKLISEEHLTANGNPEVWANESHRYAQSAWLNNGAQINDSYYINEIKVVNERLALAGLRLAAILDEAFATSQNR